MFLYTDEFMKSNDAAKALEVLAKIISSLTPTGLQRPYNTAHDLYNDSITLRDICTLDDVKRALRCAPLRTAVRARFRSIFDYALDKSAAAGISGEFTTCYALQINGCTINHMHSAILGYAGSYMQICVTYDW